LSRARLGGLAVAFVALAATAAHGQFMTGPRPESVPPAGSLSAQQVIEQVGFDQNLGARLPLDVVLRDEQGNGFRLGELFGERPVVLAFVYFRCPLLCPLVERGAATAAKPLDLEPGRDYDFVFVSIDPEDTPERARERRAETVARYGRDADPAGWHFLTGAEEPVRRLADAAGFHWTRDPMTGEFAHAAGLIVATPDGQVSRYLYGAEYSSRDLQLALVESSQGKIGGPVEKLLLYCFRYDAGLGKYTAVSMLWMRILAAVTVAALAIYFLITLLRGRRSKHAEAGGLA
jgi:protein SCO1/2